MKTNSYPCTAGPVTKIINALRDMGCIGPKTQDFFKLIGSLRQNKIFLTPGI